MKDMDIVYFLHYRSMAHQYIIGIDEVGRGALAGPLCVGAFLVRRENAVALRKTLACIKDSKQLSPRKRAEWFRRVADAASEGKCEWRTVFASAKVIDERGLSVCMSNTIARVLKKLGVAPRASLVLLDGGIRAPSEFLLQQTIVKGDEKVPLIAAASIMAKVRRDRYMVRLAKRYPQYEFDSHKGYGTARHYAALKKYGVCPVHRLSFLKRLRLK